MIATCIIVLLILQASYKYYTVQDPAQATANIIQLQDVWGVLAGKGVQLLQKGKCSRTSKILQTIIENPSLKGHTLRSQIYYTSTFNL